MMSKKAIRIICIIMAALMILSAVVVALQVVAVDEAYYETYVNPATGDSDSDYLVPAGIAVAAILAVIICVALPKMKNKDGDDEEDDEDEDEEAEEEKPKKSAKKKNEPVKDKKSDGKPQIIKSDKDKNKKEQ